MKRSRTSLKLLTHTQSPCWMPTACNPATKRLTCDKSWLYDRHLELSVASSKSYTVSMGPSAMQSNKLTGLSLSSMSEAKVQEIKSMIWNFAPRSRL